MILFELVILFRVGIGGVGYGFFIRFKFLDL